MQKKLIALAIAGLSSAAFAQSNVTVYGVADASFETFKATGGTANAAAANNEITASSRSRVLSNSSYIGFKGTESLGNGMSALFQIENQFAIDNAQNASAGTTANSLANRDSFVGLTGGFGTAIMGYLSTPYRSLAAKFDVMPGATGVAGFNGLIGRVNYGTSIAANGTTTNTFAANANTIGRIQAVAYVTPNFSGLSATLAYVPNEGKALSTANSNAWGADAKGWNVALNYDNGPLKAGYSYLTTEDLVTAAGAFNGAGAQDSKTKSHLFAVGYTFGGATTVNFMWNTNKLTQDYAAGANGGSEVKNRVLGLGVKHLIGAHELAAVYYRANDGTVGNVGTGAQTASERGASQFGLRYAYNFSKRTQLYGVYSKISNKANGNYDFGAGTGVSTSTANTIAAGSDPTAWGVGVRHSF